MAAPALTLIATVAALLLLVLAFDVVKLWRVKRGATPLGTLAVRRARLGTSRTVTTPTAIGYVHPAVVLPEGFAARVDDREWDAIVAHECAHLARLDDWAKALQSVVLRAGWWLPGLWVLGRALDLERELASDERAAGATGARRYAACLLRLATDRGTDALAPAFGARRSHVAIRVERLLRPGRDGAPLLRGIALGAFTAVAFGLLGAAVLAVPGTVARPVVAHYAVPRHAASGRLAERMRHPGQLTAARRFAFVASGPAPQSAVSARREAARPAHETAPQVWAVREAAAHAARPAHGAASRNASARGSSAVRTVAVAPPAARDEPGRRTATRRPPPVRTVLSPAETLAFANVPRSRCETCFGPLRSADDAAGTQAATLAPSGGPPAGGSAAIAADDPTAGPVSLSSQMLWFRLPTRVMQRP
ncbi:MAG TPA: M56 family metallopeptidase [Candidatus Limnocylindrales bacterium]|nr:M56 family metallopeptidase [Candidatus Limnocylindrales bacterium]